MILLDELKTELSSYIPEIKELSDVLNIENSKVELEELRNKAAEPGFWDRGEEGPAGPNSIRRYSRVTALSKWGLRTLKR